MTILQQTFAETVVLQSNLSPSSLHLKFHALGCIAYNSDQVFQCLLYVSRLGKQEAELQSKFLQCDPAAEMTALVVDDDTVNQMVHRQLLDNLGIQNQVVRNGKEAIDVHHSGKSFDLILMDMEMPVMNGIEATRKLRTMGIRTTIAGVSTCSTEKEKQEFIEAGLDDYQEKPLTTTKLSSVVQRVKKKSLN